MFRRLAAFGLILALAGASAASADAQNGRESGADPKGSTLGVLPLRSRGLSPVEQQRIEEQVLAGYRSVRVEVLSPADLPARLFRGGRYRASFEEARRRTAEGVERYRTLDRAGAREMFDRAIELFAGNFGEFVEPAAYAEALVWRGAQRISADEPEGAKADFFQAATVAPAFVPTLDEFPPPVVRAWESARQERARRPLAPEDPAVLSDLAQALRVAAVATARAERSRDAILLDLAVWSPAGNDPARTSRLSWTPPLAGDSGRVGSAASALGESLRPAPAIEASTVNVARREPMDPRLRQPIPNPGTKPPPWKNPWVWAVVGGVVAAGAGAGYLEQGRRRRGPEPFKVIVVPPDS